MHKPSLAQAAITTLLMPPQIEGPCAFTHRLVHGSEKGKSRHRLAGEGKSCVDVNFLAAASNANLWPIREPPFEADSHRDGSIAPGHFFLPLCAFLRG
jgi:hypothetical protein